jgi:ribose/xylose/arabinose/galactoside ABC-type transport system permease subunit
LALGADGFTSPRNIEMILRHTVVVGTAAVGMTVVMIMGGIDLSVGSVVALASVTAALVLGAESAEGTALLDRAPTLWPLVAAGAAVAAGALCGLVNGALITGLRVVPFIVTLGMMGIVRGTAKALGENQKVNAPQSWLDELVASPWRWIGCATSEWGCDHFPRVRAPHGKSRNRFRRA